MYHSTKQSFGKYMAIQKTSSEEILKESAKLFKIKGYYNTSMSDIANACGLLKGSIYHHFKGKDAIGISSLKYIHKYFNEEIYSIAYRNDLEALEKMKLFVKKTDDYFLRSEGGCLLGNLALEVPPENIIFRNEIQEYFTNWEKALFFIFKDKFDNNKSEELAKEFVALLQGSIMMMNLYHDSARYLKIGQKMIQLLE